MPWLKMLEGETPGRAFPLNKEVTVLGRDAACEIVLSDHGVSKRHAKITRKDDGFTIEDPREHQRDQGRKPGLDGGLSPGRRRSHLGSATLSSSFPRPARRS